ncbi:MAG: hypothetical protein ACFFDH_02415 [Promethearchaeota archaeon]
MKKKFTKKVLYMLLSEWYCKCPKCEKKIIFEEGKPKTIIRCSKCSRYILLIRGESEGEIYEFLTKPQGQFFNYDIFPYGNYLLLVGTFNFAEENIQLLIKRSKKLGLALDLFLSDGNKKRLSYPQKNLLYKLKAENIMKIQRIIEEKVKYLRVKIECIKLLRILDY